jgi:hypothetical protein
MTVLGVGLVGATVLGWGCGNSDSGSSTGSSGPSNQPPAKPSAPAATLGTYRTFALNQLFLGGTNRMGAPGADAWKSYGYDLDHKTTTSKSTDVCSQAAGAMKSAQTDGTNGTDNSFGENILPIITSVQATAEADINKSLKEGSFTVMLDIQGLTDDPAQSNTGLSGQILAGGNYDPKTMMAPAFDLTTDWPVTPELLTDGKTIDHGSKVQLSADTTYIAGGVFVSQASKISLSLAVGGDTLTLDINQAIITFTHSSAHLADIGTIAGVIDTEQLISGLQKIAGRLETSLCNDSAAFEQIAQEIRQASDIMTDGSNAAGAACTGISVGLGFTAAEIKHPDTVAPAATAGSDPCNMTDAGGGGTDSGNGGTDSGNGGNMDAGTD